MSLATTPLLSAIILTVVFALMWRQHRERWLGLWAIAAALWVARYGLAVLLGDYKYLPGAHLLPAIAIGRGFFLLWGSHAMLRRPLPVAWRLVFGADVALLLGEWMLGDLILLGARGVTHYALFGSATLVAAWRVASHRRELGAEAMLVATGLALIGTSNLTFPWTSQLPQAAPVLFTVAHAAQLIVGFGALLIFYRRANAERDAALGRLELALSKALAGYLPICAHCKAIQNEQGEWERLERYFTHRHDAAFSHGICPPCEQEHYGDLAELTAAPREMPNAELASAPAGALTAGR